MLSWLAGNIGTIIVLSVLILAVALIIRAQIREKKAGRSSCGSNCGHCAMAGKCHTRQGA